MTKKVTRHEFIILGPAAICLDVLETSQKQVCRFQESWGRHRLAKMHPSMCLTANLAYPEDGSTCTFWRVNLPQLLKVEPPTPFAVISGNFQNLELIQSQNASSSQMLKEKNHHQDTQTTQTCSPSPWTLKILETHLGQRVAASALPWINQSNAYKNAYPTADQRFLYQQPNQ